MGRDEISVSDTIVWARETSKGRKRKVQEKFSRKREITPDLVSIKNGECKTPKNLKNECDSADPDSRSKLDILIDSFSKGGFDYIGGESNLISEFEKGSKYVSVNKNMLTSRVSLYLLFVKSFVDLRLILYTKAQTEKRIKYTR